MEPIVKRKVLNLVQFLFNNYVSEEHKNLLMLKYGMSDSFEEICEELMIDVYRTYERDTLKLDFYLQYLSNRYFNGISVNDIKKKILDKLESNFECGDYSLVENHKAVESSLMFICSELNKRNVDYYVLGSVPIYVKLGISFSRFHSDIDIAINSKDLDVLKDIFKDSDYVYFDNRFCSQKFFDYNEKRARGGHEIIAQHRNSDFSIGFYEFDRLDDNSITKKDYFSEVVDGNLISRVCKYVYSKEFTDLYYSNDKLEFNGVSFRYCNIEGIYLLKQKNYMNIGRNKDIYDIHIIEKYYDINNERVLRMKELLSEAANYIIEEIGKE